MRLRDVREGKTSLWPNAKMRSNLSDLLSSGSGPTTMLCELEANCCQIRELFDNAMAVFDKTDIKYQSHRRPFGGYDLKTHQTAH